MGLCEDIMKTLERIPVWKRVKELPSEVDALRKRIEAIEKRLDGGSGKLCPACGSPKFKLESSLPDPHLGRIGVLNDHFACLECGHQKTQQRETRKLSR